MADPVRPEARILVVDDEQALAKGCRRALESEGFPTDTAEAAEPGLEMLRQGNYDLVLVDLKMPGMDGLEFLAEARKLERDTAYVMVSAYGTLQTAVAATKSGAYDFIAKPFSYDELITVVRRALDNVAVIRERNRLQEERAGRLLELATEKGRLRSIVESMSDGVIVTNRQGQVVLYNATALQAAPFSASPDEARGLHECLAHPELLALIEEALAGGEVKRMAREVRVAGADKVLMASVAPVLDPEGECLGAVTVLSDVSELKRVEQVKAQFVNMVAHELRAPLAAVDGHIMVLLEGIVADPAKQHEMLQRSHARLAALLEMVSDLLSVSRMEAGAIRREIRPLDVEEIVQETCELLRPLAEKSQVTVSVATEPDLPPLEADREEIVHLLTNLVSNAIKYNRPGGSATVRASAEGAFLVLEVEDTGAGISEEGLRKIFDEFYREKTDVTRHVTGTGLGLSIVKRIVDAYHGEIPVRSRLGEGSVFTVRLPLSQSGAA